MAPEGERQVVGIVEVLLPSAVAVIVLAFGISQVRDVVMLFWLGTLVNVVLSLSKLTLARFALHSKAIMADAIHGLGDTVAEVVAAIAYAEALRPPDKEHPWGHGKIETVGAVVVACLLLYIAASMGWDSASTVLPMLRRQWRRSTSPRAAADVNGGSAEELDGLDDGPESEALRVLSEGRGVRLCIVGVTLTSILLKEALFASTLIVGEREHSNLIVANAWHHRSDSLAAAVALTSQVGASFGHHYLDPLGGGVVAAMLAHSAFDSLHESFNDLVDYNAAVGSDGEPGRSRCGALLSNSIAEVEGVRNHSLRTRRMGPYCLVDATIVVDARISASAASIIAESVHDRVLADFRPFVTDVNVHVDPEGSPQSHRLDPSAEPPIPDAGGAGGAGGFGAAGAGDGAGGGGICQPEAEGGGGGSCLDMSQIIGPEALEARVREALLAEPAPASGVGAGGAAGSGGEGLLPRIAEVTELQSYYYVAEDQASSGARPYIEIKADIRLDDERISIRTAAAVARAARSRVLAALPGIVRDIDLDLELSEEEEEEDEEPLGGARGVGRGPEAATYSTSGAPSESSSSAAASSSSSAACDTGARPGHGSWHDDLCADRQPDEAAPARRWKPKAVDRHRLQQVTLIWERGTESRGAQEPAPRRDQRFTWTPARGWSPEHLKRWGSGGQKGALAPADEAALLRP